MKLKMCTNAHVTIVAHIKLGQNRMKSHLDNKLQLDIKSAQRRTNQHRLDRDGC